MLLGLLACGPKVLDSFVALPADFEDFQSWDSVVPDGAAHGDVPRTVFANEWVGSEPDRFPTGSVLVKVAETADGPITHAMARRGDDYNLDGAVGWEWLELDHIDDPVPRIAWRGSVPPDGEDYALFADTDTADPTLGDCNGCHLSAFANQYVFTIPLGE